MWYLAEVFSTAFSRLYMGFLTAFGLHRAYWSETCLFDFSVVASEVCLLGYSVVAIVRINRRELQPGHCVKCDYNLLATPDRCPECGTVPNVRMSRSEKDLEEE